MVKAAVREIDLLDEVANAVPAPCDWHRDRTGSALCRSSNAIGASCHLQCDGLSRQRSAENYLHTVVGDLGLDASLRGHLAELRRYLPLVTGHDFAAAASDDHPRDALIVAPSELCLDRHVADQLLALPADE